ncbi:MAG: PilW family protein [Gammaproteobacteria bacterium]|nr:PilW family protein [Gammaproteobacteria bacterium]
MHRQSGLSLLELMVAITIGGILMTGLVVTFNNSSDSRRELEKAGNLIENGRYAISLIYDDLRHAGYYGHIYDVGDVPGSLPDPCETSSTANMLAALPLSIQGYTAANLTTARPNISATTCDDKGLFTNANLSPGSDILVIRRADTGLFAGSSADGTTTIVTGTPTTGEVYIQANMREGLIQIGNSGAGTVNPSSAGSKTADNQAQSLKKFPSKTSPTTWADTRKYRVHVYFVAPCSFGSGTNGVCQASDDSVPTLKRLELTTSGSGTIMQVMPLVEGVQLMKAEYGIDTSPAALNTTTGYIGDGVPDSYITPPTEPTLANLSNVVSVRVHLLIRSTDATQGFSDSKQYLLAGSTAGPFNDTFKRHVYMTEARPMNMAGRREIPD